MVLEEERIGKETLVLEHPPLMGTSLIVDFQSNEGLYLFEINLIEIFI